MVSSGWVEELGGQTIVRLRHRNLQKKITKMWLKRIFARKAIRLVALLVGAALGGALANVAMAPTLAGAASGLPAAATITPPVSPLLVRYQLDIPSGGEIFPALAGGGPSDYWPMAVLTIANTSPQSLVETVMAEIPGWSRSSIQTVTLGPHQTQIVRLDPELLSNAYENAEIRRATLQVHAEARGSLGFDEGYNQTRAVFLHSVSDFYWGRKFANAQYIARWVTPHDPAVIQLVSTARSYVPRGRLAGYELPAKSAAPTVADQVQSEARAIFAAMQHLGISYVDSISTFGNFKSTAERVRLPHETLATNSANCIDMSVAFASAVENLGMDPVIVLVPGHAFTGVRFARGSSRILYLDLTVLPDGSFDHAVARAQHWIDTTPKALVNVIDIAAARAARIYPLPPTSRQKT